MSSSDRYMLISADTHACATEEVYRSYVEPRHRGDFDAWRNGPAPVEDPVSVQDDSEMAPPPREPDTARNDTQNADGVVGEVIFADGQPPFFPESVFTVGPPRPEDYPLRRAGVQAQNRWMADYCNDFPTRRAGVGMILLNDLDDTIAEVEWIAENGLRGGLQLPNITPDVDWIAHVGDRRYDRLWAACQDLDVVVNMHVETSFPRMGPDPAAMVPLLAEGPHYLIRPLLLMVLAGVFERFPGLRVALSEQPISILAGAVDYLDPVYAVMREAGAWGNFALDPSVMLPKPPSDYLRSNVWYTASPPLVGDLAFVEATVGFDHLMVGNDYPHYEGTAPWTLQILRQLFHDWAPEAIRRVFAETPAALYGFDMDALAPDAARFGPLVDDVAAPPDALPDEPNYVLVANALHRAKT